MGCVRWLHKNILVPQSHFVVDSLRTTATLACTDSLSINSIHQQSDNALHLSYQQKKKSAHQAQKKPCCCCCCVCVCVCACVCVCCCCCCCCFIYIVGLQNSHTESLVAVIPPGTPVLNALVHEGIDVFVTGPIVQVQTESFP